MSSPIQLIAHRGYARHYPENTLLAFEAALRAGARYVETDVQLSADGVPVLFHDRTLARVCGEEGAVHDHPLAALRSMRALEFDRFGYRFARARLATLGEFCELLSAHPDVTAFVEIKRVALERFGADAVLAAIAPLLAPLAARAVLISFDVSVLARARAYPSPTWCGVGGVVDRWHERRRFAALSPEYLFCDREGLPRFGRLRFGKSRVAIYEVDDPTEALRLTQRGAALIETFALGEMAAALNR